MNKDFTSESPPPHYYLNLWGCIHISNFYLPHVIQKKTHALTFNIFLYFFCCWFLSNSIFSNTITGFLVYKELKVYIIQESFVWIVKHIVGSLTGTIKTWVKAWLAGCWPPVLSWVYVCASATGVGRVQAPRSH